MIESPLKIAREQAKEKTCLRCEKRVVINNISYCEDSEKLLHPYLLVAGYPTRCPHELKREDRK